jgi:transcriptional regulator with XRE-family HTH domain
MTPTTLTPLGLALGFLRSIQGWSQKDLADAAGLHPNLLSDYERGRKPLSRERLEPLVQVLGLPVETIDIALAFIDSVRAAASRPGSPVEPEQRRIEAAALEAGRHAANFARSFLTSLATEARVLKDRQRAETLWARLQRRKPAERLILVEEAAEYRSWALCERLCHESVKAARDKANRALELAELALRVAELAPGEEAWRSRLQGYAWAHVGNARRVGSDLPGADAAFVEAWRLWQAGASSNSGLLDESRLPDLQASLRRDQRRFADALALLDDALAAGRGELRGRILLKKATVLFTLGDFKEAVVVLRDATPFVEGEREPGLIFALQFNLAVNLCFLGRHAEAEKLLHHIREVAAGNDLDLVRLRWLEGRVAAGMGRREAALTALSSAREEFTTREIAYDAALVTLELAALYLDDGRTAEVRTLSRHMMWVFQAQGVHQEARAALHLFREAAERDAATSDMVRNMVQFLHRAQYDPALRFDAAA